MKSRGFILFIAVVAIAALVVGLLALNAAGNARQLALSEVAVEEVNSLNTPVFDEASGAYKFLALYDISIANMSGPAVTLTHIKKVQSGGGFLTLLKGEEVVSADVQEKAIVSEQSSAAVQANPKLLKSLLSDNAGDDYAANMKIEPGETKLIHLGVLMHPFTDAGTSLANVALASWKLEFSNGKTYVFRRGFPIYPIQK